MSIQINNEHMKLSDLHPCVNCGKKCEGKQCRDCDRKMIQTNCVKNVIASRDAIRKEKDEKNECYMTYTCRMCGYHGKEDYTLCGSCIYYR